MTRISSPLTTPIDPDTASAIVVMAGTEARQPTRDTGWTQEFGLEADELVSTGRNPYFSLEPGDRSVLAHGAMQLTIIVLADTRVIDRVETRVVEERETNNG